MATTDDTRERHALLNTEERKAIAEHNRRHGEDRRAPEPDPRSGWQKGWDYLFHQQPLTVVLVLGILATGTAYWDANEELKSFLQARVAEEMALRHRLMGTMAPL